MSIERIALRGFKCFAHAEIALAPLTLLTGFNAAGKSTTLQTLLLLAQSLRSSPESQFLPLNGNLVRLGTAGEVIRSGGRATIRFEISGFKSHIAWKLGVPTSTEEDDTPRRERLEVYKVVQDGQSLYDDKKHARVRPMLSPLRRAIREIIFLSATRHGRQDIFPSPDDADPVHADVGNEGQFAPWWYVRMADEQVDPVRRHPDDPSITLRAQVDAWLNHLFPGAAANAETIAGTGYSRLEFRVGRTSAWARPANIGYGLSYAFPLIVALLAARPSQIIVVDSPEAHLHPRAQSRMGAMLARFAQAGVQLLVETHSDHVLSGARLAVRNGDLLSSRLAIHFFSGAREDGSNGIISPAVLRDGGLSDWPEGFFDQGEIDLTTLAEF